METQWLGNFGKRSPLIFTAALLLSACSGGDGDQGSSAVEQSSSSVKSSSVASSVQSSISSSVVVSSSSLMSSLSSSSIVSSSSVSSAPVSSSSSSSAASSSVAPEKAFIEFTDPSCTDGQYIEALPDLDADISGLIDEVYALASPTKEQLEKLQIDVFDLAYPYGAFILTAAGTEGSGDVNVSCAQYWSDPDGGTFPESIWGIVIQECGHALDFKFGEYFISDGNEFDIPTEDFYARAEIITDKHHSKIPNAAANRLYFEGTANQLGLQTTLSLWSQYIHSVAADYTVYSFPSLQFQFDIDGMINFAWAVPRYLLVGKERFPNDYNRLMADPVIRETILTLWGRTWLYYDAFKENTSWSPFASQLKYVDAIRDPEILNMMNELRAQHACDGIN